MLAVAGRLRGGCEGHTTNSTARQAAQHAAQEASEEGGGGGLLPTCPAGTSSQQAPCLNATQRGTRCAAWGVHEG